MDHNIKISNILQKLEASFVKKGSIDSWVKKVEKFKKEKEKRYKDAIKQDLKHQKEIETQRKQQEKLDLENASAAKKMRLNWEKYREKAIKAFSGGYNSNLTSVGMKFPNFPKKPEDIIPTSSQVTKVASYISDLGYESIESKISHSQTMNKLNRIIKKFK